MNINLNFLKHKKTFRKGGLHTNPDIYWNILQALALLLVISSFAFGFYLFQRIDREFVSLNETTDTQTRSIGKDRIDKALSYFAEKEKKSNEILNSPAPIIDPSR